MYVLKETMELAFIWNTLNQVLENDYSNSKFSIMKCLQNTFFPVKIIFKGAVKSKL